MPPMMPGMMMPPRMPAAAVQPTGPVTHCFHIRAPIHTSQKYTEICEMLNEASAQLSNTSVSYELMSVHKKIVHFYPQIVIKNKAGKNIMKYIAGLK